MSARQERLDLLDMDDFYKQVYDKYKDEYGDEGQDDDDDEEEEDIKSSDEESGMYKSMEEESRSELDDNDDISSDSNHADSVEIGDITNISLMWRMIRWMGSMLKTVLMMSLTKSPLTSGLRVSIP